MYVTCEVWPNQSHQPTEDQMEDVDPQPKKTVWENLTSS